MRAFDVEEAPRMDNPGSLSWRVELNVVIEKSPNIPTSDWDLFDDIRFEDSFPVFLSTRLAEMKGELGLLGHIGKEFKPHHQIFLPHIDRIIAHFVVGVDKEVNAEKGIPAFGFRLRRQSKKEISGVEEEDFSPFFFHLGDQRGFLGNAAKRVSESPARLDLAHHIVRVDDAELCFRVLGGKKGGYRIN